MGFLQILKQPRERKSLGICVPEAYKKRHSIEVEEQPISMGSAFKVSGVFAFKDSITLEGKMVQGSLRAGNEIEFSGKRLKVTDVSVERRPAERIEEGQRGAIFLQVKSFPMVKAGDLLEF